MDKKEKDQKVLRYAQLVLRAEQQGLSPEDQHLQKNLLKELSMSDDEALKFAAALLMESNPDH